MIGKYLPNAFAQWRDAKMGKIATRQHTKKPLTFTHKGKLV